MIDPNEYKKLLDNNERRISHKAMLTALMISLYHQQPCFQQAYQMLGLLMDIDALMSSWRRMYNNFAYIENCLNLCFYNRQTCSFGTTTNWS